MKTRPIEPAPGQESVWDYPRPPALEDSSRHIQVRFNGVTIADTRRAKRVLETSHPPVYYIPPEDVRMELLKENPLATWCEWKGLARYYDVEVNGQKAETAAWYYPLPTRIYEPMMGYVAFYPQAMEACFVDGERVQPQEEDGRSADYGTYRAGYAGDYGYGRRSSYTGTGYDYDEYDLEEGEGRLSAAKDKVKDVAGSAREKVGEAVGTAREKVGEATGWTKEHALDLGHRAKGQARALKGKAKYQAHRAKTGLWQSLEENPLMVGAATLAVGVIAGLLIPETEKENELMGETRDRLVEEVKEAGQQTLEKGKHVAEAVADKVKDEVKNAGLTPEGMAEKVKNVAKEAVNTAKEEARNQDLTPAALKPEAKPELHEHEPELVKR